MEKMKYLILALVALTLTACVPDVDNSGVKKSTYDTGLKKDPRLSDCFAVALLNEYGTSMTVIRCPNSTVTTLTQEKHPIATVVIDGVTYAPTGTP